jgi:hypothetical protein
MIDIHFANLQIWYHQVTLAAPRLKRVRLEFLEILEKIEQSRRMKAAVAQKSKI